MWASLLVNKTTISILLIFLILGGGFFYHKYLKTQIHNLKESNKILERNNETQKETIEKLTNNIRVQERTIKQTLFDIKTINKAYKKMQTRYKMIVIERDALNEKFHKKTSITNEERDIGKIATVKPNLFNKVINDASKKQIRCLEIASKSPKIDGDEKICPHLFVGIE